MIQTTIKAAKSAYAPYSQFNVSAGVLLENGKIITGTNVENASYPVGICAERNVLSHVISNYPTVKIKALAVYAERQNGQAIPDIITPCGMCRQALVETENRQNQDYKIILIGHGNQFIEVENAKCLLPLAFDKTQL